jgi:hypothetical protein
MPAYMSVESAAAAVACRTMGYRGLAEALGDGLLSPRAAADMLRRHGTDSDGMVAATILLVASTARWRAQRDGWNGDVEKALALDALRANARRLRRPPPSPLVSMFFANALEPLAPVIRGHIAERLAVNFKG